MSDAATVLAPERMRHAVRRPYPGFRPFRRDEWRIFFGRDGQVEALLDRLAHQHFVCIHGPSGCGKSSLIEAGLMATLDREARRAGTVWNCAIFRPGASPLWNMARGLARALGGGTEPSSETVLAMHARLTRPGGSIAQTAKEALGESGNLLLVADQFEELFRFSALGNELEARRFVELLLAVFDQHPPGVHVAIAMRSDFLGDCSSMIGLAEAVNAAPFLTPMLTEQELRDAIAGPAEMIGGAVEPAFVERILRDSAPEPDRLPIVQHALMRCWDTAAAIGSANRLTIAVYEAVGGVGKALDAHADEVMGKLKGCEREVERMFRSLSDLDNAGRAIRRAVPWGQLRAETGCEKSDTSLLKALDAFRDESCGFLGRPPLGEELKPDSVVDVAHEALIRRWKKMSNPPLTGRGPLPAPRLRKGWLWEQVREAGRYRDLMSRARDHKIGYLPAKLLKTEQGWWRAQPRTAAWGRRMGGDRDATPEDAARDIASIDELFGYSRKMQLAANALIALIVLLMLGGAAYLVDEQVDRQQMQQLQLARETALANQQEAERADFKRQLDEEKQKTLLAEQNLGRLQQNLVTSKPLPKSSSPSPLSERTTEITSPEAKAVVLPLLAPLSASADNGTTCQGAMWIGGDSASNLRLADTDGGGPVTAANVKAGMTYVATTSVRLRRGLPDANYLQQDAIGIVPKGAEVVALGNPRPYTRQTEGPQYWLEVRVAGQICSVVYFQFYGVPADRAHALAEALAARGYTVPGQEELRTAQGLAQVRYFYDEDRARAEQLAKDAQAAVDKLGLAAGRRMTVDNKTSWPRAKPSIGTLELWVDLTAVSSK